MVWRATWQLFALGLIAFLCKAGLNQALVGFGASGFAMATSLTGLVLLAAEIGCLLWLHPCLLAWRDFLDLVPFAVASVVLVALLGKLPALSPVLLQGAGAAMLTTLAGGAGLMLLLAALVLLFRLPEAADLVRGVRIIMTRCGLKPGV
jgi:hypothetical protein